jgi:SNF2 family DNA or RNA helicase
LENCGIDISKDPHLKATYKYVRANLGILGDKVGSGKSYTMLALILANPVPKVKYNKTFVYGGGHMGFKMNPIVDNVYIDVNMIVMSHSLVKQWEHYVKTFTNELRVFVVNSKKTFNMMESNLQNTQLLFVTANFYKNVQMYMNERDVTVKRLIFDEVDTAYTPNAKRINAKFYWFISASYKNILNPFPRWHYNHEDWRESYQITSGIHNNLFAKSVFVSFLKTMTAEEMKCVDLLVLKNNDEFVERSFSLMEYETRVIQCKTPDVVNILNGISNKRILQSLNAGDVGTAISLLNQENVGDEENIIDIVKCDFKNRLNNANLRLDMAQNYIFNNPVAKETRIRKLEHERDEILQKIRMIEERVRESNLCNICYNEMETKTITKCCKNSFCIECITRWLSKMPNCPLCKSTMCDEDLYVLVKDYVPHPGVQFPEGQMLEKLDQMKVLLRDTIMVRERHKVLIFSEYDHVFNNLIKVVKDLNANYGFLKGNSIGNNVNRYKSNADFNILFVNPNAYGSGLNLENTTDIIMFHKLNEQVTKQVIGRAQRPGRKDKLHVWFLLHENEIVA